VLRFAVCGGGRVGGLGVSKGWGGLGGWDDDDDDDDGVSGVRSYGVTNVCRNGIPTTVGSCFAPQTSSSTNPPPLPPLGVKKPRQKPTCSTSTTSDAASAWSNANTIPALMSALSAVRLRRMSSQRSRSRSDRGRSLGGGGRGDWRFVLKG